MMSNSMLNELKIVRPPLDSHVEKQHRIALHACEDDCFMRGKYTFWHSSRAGLPRYHVICITQHTFAMNIVMH